MRWLVIAILTAATWAQAPATGNVIDTANGVATGVTGAHLVWTKVSGATQYSVYRYVTYSYLQPCQVGHAWADVADTTSTTYDDYPTLDVNGWGGGWCYGVTATVNGKEGPVVVVAHDPPAFVIGSKWYFVVQESTSDCSSQVGNPSGPGTFKLQLTRGGVTTTLPQQFATNVDRWAGYYGPEPGDKLVATYVDPLGRVYTFTNPFLGNGEDGIATNVNWGPYLVLFHNGTGTCEVQHWNYTQR